MVGKTAGQLVQEARRRIQNLSVEQVAAELAQGGVTLVDIREAEEFREGTIAGALHVPRGLLEFRADPSSPAFRGDLDSQARVILVCKSSGRSALAADRLQQMGYANVAHLDGGMLAWVAAGKPVVRP